MEQKMYRAIQLCDGINDNQIIEVNNLLNSGFYVIHREYKFKNHVVIILKLKKKHFLVLKKDTTK